MSLLDCISGMTFNMVLAAQPPSFSKPGSPALLANPQATQYLIIKFQMSQSWPPLLQLRAITERLVQYSDYELRNPARYREMCSPLIIRKNKTALKQLRDCPAPFDWPFLTGWVMPSVGGDAAHRSNCCEISAYAFFLLHVYFGPKHSRAQHKNWPYLDGVHCFSITWTISP